MDWIPRTSPGSMCQFPLPLHIRSSAANKNPPMDVLLFSLSLDISALNFASKVCPVHPAVFFLSSLFPLLSSLLTPPLHRTEEALLQSLTFVLTFFFFLFFSFPLPLLFSFNPYRLDLNRLLLFSSFDLLI